MQHQLLTPVEDNCNHENSAVIKSIPIEEQPKKGNIDPYLSKEHPGMGILVSALLVSNIVLASHVTWIAHERECHSMKPEFLLVPNKGPKNDLFGSIGVGLTISNEDQRFEMMGDSHVAIIR